MSVKLKTFLDLIAFSEGTSTSPLTANNGYDVIVSGPAGPEIFSNYSEHPFFARAPKVIRKVPFLISTAAGRYQILFRFWRVYKRQLGLTDFSPASQDAVAFQILKERGVTEESFEIEKAIHSCSNIWASFPGNNYEQGGHSMATLVAKYEELLGVQHGA